MAALLRERRRVERSCKRGGEASSDQVLSGRLGRQLIEPVDSPALLQGRGSASLARGRKGAVGRRRGRGQGALGARRERRAPAGGLALALGAPAGGLRSMPARADPRLRAQHDRGLRTAPARPRRPALLHDLLVRGLRKGRTTGDRRLQRPCAARPVSPTLAGRPPARAPASTGL